MPAPSILSQVNYTGWDSGSAQTVLLTPPSGMTTGHLDLLIVAWSRPNAQTFNNTAPSGYTEVINDKQTVSGSTTACLSIYRRSAEATPANVTVTIADSNVQAVATRIAWADVDLANPINVTGSLLTGSVVPEDSPQTTHTIPAATTTAADCTAIAAFCWATGLVGNRPGVYSASGWTNIFDDNGGSSSDSPTAYFGRKVIAAAGTTGTAVLTPEVQYESGVQARAYVGRIIALNGVAGGGGGSARRRVVVVM